MEWRIKHALSRYELGEGKISIEEIRGGIDVRFSPTIERINFMGRWEKVGTQNFRFILNEVGGKLLIVDEKNAENVGTGVQISFAQGVNDFANVDFLLDLIIRFGT